MAFESEEAVVLNEIVGLLALQLRYSGIPQGVLVHDLSDFGIQPKRIAELLGTTPNTVSQQKRRPRPSHTLPATTGGDDANGS